MITTRHRVAAVALVGASLTAACGQAARGDDARDQAGPVSAPKSTATPSSTLPPRDDPFTPPGAPFTLTYGAADLVSRPVGGDVDRSKLISSDAAVTRARGVVPAQVAQSADVQTALRSVTLTPSGVASDPSTISDRLAWVVVTASSGQGAHGGPIGGVVDTKKYFCNEIVVIDATTAKSLDDERICREEN